MDASGRRRARALHTLLDWPAKQRMPNLLVIGPTNNGKSMIVEKFRRSHPPVSHPDREEIPVLMVRRLSGDSLRRPVGEPLRSLPSPIHPRSRR
ncbi:TniB family NTP-binding protein [Nonomuraea sp. NPDC005983]|uniref:TniB family NTP-binding protein n=1 Tax=Nonomuraea sp. NPDC005983 TaxID=3155595 RepID=UPI0033B217CD